MAGWCARCAGSRWTLASPLNSVLGGRGTGVVERGNFLKHQVAPDGLPLLSQFSEDGFVDCMFQVARRSDFDDHIELVIRASHDGQPVGLKVLVRRDIGGGFDSKMNLVPDHVYRAGVSFLRSGPESDALVAALANLYELPEASLRMVQRLEFTAIALHRDAEVDMEALPIKIKLFAYDREEDPADRYSESFFNLDLANGFVFWNEKDQEYREPVLRGLAIHDGN